MVVAVDEQVGYHNAKCNTSVKVLDNFNICSQGFQTLKQGSNIKALLTISMSVDVNPLRVVSTYYRVM